MSLWTVTTCVDPRAAALSDRHYPRRKRPPRKSARFVGPGSPLVLLTTAADAVWVTLVQRPEFVDHAWPGAWLCTLFRNEGENLSSDLIREAVERSCERFGALPEQHGFVTFVDEVATSRGRSRRSLAGACFRHAGWREVARIPAGHGRPAKGRAPAAKRLPQCTTMTGCSS